MEQKTGKRLVLFPLPYVGHQNPMFELGNIFYSRGFSISVIHTRYCWPNTAKYPHFSFHLIDDGLSKTEASFDEIIAVIILLNKKCVESFRVCLSQILTDALDQDTVTCLIVDSMFYFSQAVADDLKVPRIVLRPTNMSSFNVSTLCAALDLKDREPGDLIPGHPPVRVMDISRATAIDQSPFQEYISSVKRETKACRGLIMNSFIELEDRSISVLEQNFRIPVFPIGPLHKWLPCLSGEYESSLSWLDTQESNSVLYVSFGSLAAIDKAEFLEMAWGLANSNRPFLWVIREDLVNSSDGLSQLPNEFLQQVLGRGHIVGWASQKTVLAHPAVGGFWTHCGWNSLLESICEGVPVICSPFFADQMINTRYVTEVWKIGLRLEKGSKTEDVEKAIKILMAEEEGEEMRKRAACLKNKASECLQPGGSSYKYMEDLVSFIMSF